VSLPDAGDDDADGRGAGGFSYVRGNILVLLPGGGDNAGGCDAGPLPKVRGADCGAVVGPGYDVAGAGAVYDGVVYVVDGVQELQDDGAATTGD